MEYSSIALPCLIAAWEMEGLVATLKRSGS